MCAAPLGNQYAVGRGRPIKVEAALGRIEDDADRLERVARLYEQSVVAAVLQNADPPLPPQDYDPVAARMATGVRHLRRALDQLRADFEALKGAPLPARRKRGPRTKIHGDPFSEAVATAAVALDRLCTEESPN